MKRSSKKEIRAAIQLLKAKPTDPIVAPNPDLGMLAEKKSPQKIRKQGV